MDTGLLANFIDPAILFFFFGAFAAATRSNLEIPASIAKFFSLYLLIAIGFKGGVALSTRGFTTVAATGIAATYGAISAVTFIAAQQFLTRNDVDFGGHMTVAMVLMESPAIIMAVLLAS